MLCDISNPSLSVDTGYYSNSQTLEGVHILQWISIVCAVCILCFKFLFLTLFPGSPPSKHNVKSQWLIIDDHEMLHTTEQKALPTLLSGAPQTTSETPLKGGTKRKDDDRVVKNRTVLLSRVVKFASDTYLSYLLEYCNRLSEVSFIL